MSSINVPNDQSFADGSSTLLPSSFATIYKQFIDSSFISLGRNIMLHLQDAREPCPNPECPFDPLRQRSTRSCPVCKGTGWVSTQRDTEYKAHIIHGPKDFMIEGSPAGRLEEGEVQTTTVNESFEDLRKCQYATIDGQKFRIKANPRVIGYNTVKYIITTWSQVSTGGPR